MSEGCQIKDLIQIENLVTHRRWRSLRLAGEDYEAFLITKK